MQRGNRDSLPDEEMRRFPAANLHVSRGVDDPARIAYPLAMPEPELPRGRRADGPWPRRAWTRVTGSRAFQPPAARCDSRRCGLIRRCEAPAGVVLRPHRAMPWFHTGGWRPAAMRVRRSRIAAGG